MGDHKVGGVHVTFAKHSLTFWEERAISPSLPGTIRVAALAYSRPTPNGHVVFQTGDLRAALYTVDFATGEYTNLPSHRQVQRYVADAVKGGLLARGSTVRCLRLPTGIDIGTLGRRRDETRCPVCDQPAR